MESQQARDVDQDAGAGGAQRVDVRAAEVDEGADVQRDHVLEALRILVREGVVGAEARVVDQSRGVDAAGFEFGAERAAGIGQAEVAGNDGHRDAVGAGEFVGQALEPVRPAGDEHEIRAAAGQLSCELLAETGARPGDDGGLVAVVDFAHAVHSTHHSALSASCCMA